ncbi:SSI family serine proteinase inhibitor [Glycomyces sp. NPDC046736]|uniref:SSI family serine proteinase inhibitor n=1 Tax=Glycomyces sp. NPDC046736 TaxID=3155615 RepID=UPI0033EBEEE3
MKQFAAGAAIVGAAALVALGSTPAQAKPVPVEPGFGGQGIVHLEVEHGDGSVDSAALLCPSGIGHDRGLEACGQLAEAGGDFDALAAGDGFCTKQYDPVTLRAFGFWDGRLVHYEREFGNHCMGLNATGAVFDYS